MKVKISPKVILVIVVPCIKFKIIPVTLLQVVPVARLEITQRPLFVWVLWTNAIRAVTFVISGARGASGS